MALPGLYLDEPGSPGVLPGLEGLDGRPSRFFGKKTSFSPGTSRSINRDDPGGFGINRSTAGLSGTGALAFIDLTKAFDSVNREALWACLARLGRPPKFVNITRQLHEGMK